MNVVLTNYEGYQKLDPLQGQTPYLTDVKFGTPTNNTVGQGYLLSKAKLHIEGSIVLQDGSPLPGTQITFQDQGIIDAFDKWELRMYNDRGSPLDLDVYEAKTAGRFKRMQDDLLTSSTYSRAEGGVLYPTCGGVTACRAARIQAAGDANPFDKTLVAGTNVVIGYNANYDPGFDAMYAYTGTGKFSFDVELSSLFPILTYMNGNIKNKWEIWAKDPVAKGGNSVDKWGAVIQRAPFTTTNARVEINQMQIWCPIYKDDNVPLISQIYPTISFERNTLTNISIGAGSSVVKLTPFDMTGQVDFLVLSMFPDLDPSVQVRNNKASVALNLNRYSVRVNNVSYPADEPEYNNAENIVSNQLTAFQAFRWYYFGLDSTLDDSSNRWKDYIFGCNNMIIFDLRNCPQHADQTNNFIISLSPNSGNTPQTLTPYYMAFKRLDVFV